ncbi:MAG TPA: glycosyl hydrolase family 8 [Solirubrobacteraceae bacterium]|jgi:endoglucanase
MAATDAVYAFLDAYTTPTGRVQRTDQGGDTVGEAQAYGLLAAAAVGDAGRFERIWRWTQTHALRRDDLLVFRWADGRVQDPQAAADADLDLAHALLLAGCRFKRADLHRTAARVGRSLLDRETATARTGLVLLAGPWAAQGPTLTVNPSYLDPAALAALAQATGDRRFTAVAQTGRQIVADLARPLPPDWASLDRRSGRVTPVSGAGAGGGPGRFTYDAPRTLVRLAADPDRAGRALAARAWPVFRGRAAQDIVVEHDLDGRTAGESHHPITVVAAAAAATAAGDRAAADRLLNGAEALQRAQPSYYGGAWVALARLMLTTDRLRSCAEP